jgi:hypothetical protein
LKKRICYICFLLIFGSADAMAQLDSPFVHVKAITGNFADLAVDNLGNIYLLTIGNQLRKFGPAGDSLAIYNDVRRYGNISFMDVTNPLKILLYYQDFGTIVMVDRFLNILNTIDLRKNNLQQVSTLGLAYDNNIWIYDGLEAKLKRLDETGTVISETTDIRQMTDSAPDPQTLTDQYGLVYLYDIQQGAYLFDHYGAFQKYIPLPGWKDFSVIEKAMYGRDDHYFYKYSASQKDIERNSIPASWQPALKIVIMPKMIYVLKRDGVHVYQHS